MQDPDPSCPHPDKPKPRASYLSPPDFWRLDWACRPIHEAFGTPPYLVGSVLTRPDFRDIDLRLILADDRFDRLFSSQPGFRLLTNIAVSGLIEQMAALPSPIDFQVQSVSEANRETGPRNPMGCRNLTGGFIGYRDAPTNAPSGDPS